MPDPTLPRASRRFQSLLRPRSRHASGCSRAFHQEPRPNSPCARGCAAGWTPPAGSRWRANRPRQPRDGSGAAAAPSPSERSRRSERERSRRSERARNWRKRPPRMARASVALGAGHGRAPARERLAPRRPISQRTRRNGCDRRGAAGTPPCHSPVAAGAIATRYRPHRRGAAWVPRKSRSTSAVCSGVSSNGRWPAFGSRTRLPRGKRR